LKELSYGFGTGRYSEYLTGHYISHQVINKLTIHPEFCQAYWYLEIQFS